MKAFYNCLEKLKIQPKINISTLHPSQFPNVKIYKDSFPISPSYTLEINYRPLWNIDSRHKDSFLHCSWKQSHTEGDLTIHHSHTHTHLPLSLSTTLMIPALARICMGDHRYGDWSHDSLWSVNRKAKIACHLHDALCTYFPSRLCVCVCTVSVRECSLESQHTHTHTQNHGLEMNMSSSCSLSLRINSAL